MLNVENLRCGGDCLDLLKPWPRNRLKCPSKGSRGGKTGGGGVTFPQRSGLTLCDVAMTSSSCPKTCMPRAVTNLFSESGIISHVSTGRGRTLGRAILVHPTLACWKETLNLWFIYLYLVEESKYRLNKKGKREHHTHTHTCIIAYTYGTQHCKV